MPRKRGRQEQNFPAMKSTDLKVERRPIDALIPYARNARTHSEEQVAQIAASMKEFGWTNPVLVDGDNGIIAGHGRVMAARKLGLAEVPCIELSHLSDAQRRAYILADNKLAENAGWDTATLGQELADLKADDFDLGLIGFGEEEIDRLLSLNDATSQGNTDEDDTPEAQEHAVTEPGDIWLLGKHRVRCGDSTSADDVGALMDGAQVDVCFTSPPYLQQRDYTARSADKLSDWDALMRDVSSLLPMSDKGQVFVNLGLIHKDHEWLPYWSDWIEFMRSAGWRRFGLYVWDQGPGMAGDWSGRLAPAFELIFHFNRKSVQPKKARDCKTAGQAHGGKGQRDKHGNVKVRSSGTAPVQDKAIHDSIIRANRQSSRHDAGGHPAPYPVQLVRTFLESWGGAVYDPFLGSGTTLIAGETEGRPVYGMELAPEYVDVIVKRWQDFTGKEATLEGDGRTFNDIADQRKAA